MAGKNLTAREKQVLKLIARGMHNKEIAKTLGVTLETVKSHVSSILGKLRVKSRVKAAVVAMQNKLV